MAYKLCRGCQEFLYSESFNRDSSRYDGLSYICKNCDRKKVLKWQKENKKKHNAKGKRWKRGGSSKVNQDFGNQTYFNRLKTLQAKRFNTSVEYIENLLINQSGLCAICNNQMIKKREPHIDHNRSCCNSDKSCGKCIRGLLCMSCNIMLGFSRDNINTLKSAIKYLNKFRLMT